MNQVTKYLCNRLIKHSFYGNRIRYFSNNTSAESDNNEEEEEEYSNLVNRYLRVSEMGHQVLVVQPYIKWGPSKKTNTTPQLQLDEAVSLIRTLEKWKVMDKILVPVDRLNKKMIIGSGNLEKLKDKVKINKNISAVFFSVSMMKGFQRREYEQHFKVPVFDRYTIVIQIFKEHAVTKDAQLQIALAEIPYLRAMLNVGQDATQAGNARGSGESGLEVGRRVLFGVETKLRDKLKKLHDQRALSRKQRMQQNIPVVAVVGYTNSGKTSLIKALTGEKRLQPRDALFATLDVTAHEGLLPCRLKVLYVDTVGFMSDLPTSLIECFVATLEDVLLADVIIHIVDLSHPDVKAQTENVLATLKSLQVPDSVLANVITVGNKCDKEELFDLSELGIEPIKISATQSKGTNILTQVLEKSLLKLTDRQKMIIRVPAGGEESRWLHKETAVVDMWADPENSQYMMMGVVISKVQLAKFKSYFINKQL